MLFESTIQHVTIDNRGNDKTAKEKYIVNTTSDLFADAENILYEQFGSLTDFTVADLKKSRITEIANKREHEDDSIWLAELSNTYVDEAGNEKENRYKIIFYSQTFETAKAYIAEYLRQGYNLDIVGLKLTKFIDII